VELNPKHILLGSDNRETHKTLAETAINLWHLFHLQSGKAFAAMSSYLARKNVTSTPSLFMPIGFQSPPFGLLFLHMTFVPWRTYKLATVSPSMEGVLFQEAFPEVLSSTLGTAISVADCM
jgi:hypothetical protein